MTRKALSARKRLEIFEQHKGVCHFCGGKIHGATERWEISHEIPLGIGGADDETNMFPAHYKCHRRHTAETDQPRIAKTRRQQRKHAGATRPKAIIPGSRGTRWKRKLDGTVVER